MSYVVVWTDPASENLADVWMRSIDPMAVTRASDRIDAALARDPHTAAVHVLEGLFAVNDPPLRVLVEIDTAAEVVWVVRVNWYAGHS